MPQAMKISVALCTFNGERFIAEQLRSVLGQSRLPDELVVCDDGSSDRTVQLVEEFAASSPLPIRVFRNADRLGAGQNFGRAISFCTGDLIACCDQDDRWMPEKLARIENAFAANPSLAYAFSDAGMCDENGADLGYRLWASIFFTGRLRRMFDGSVFDGADQFEVLLRQNVVTGATLCFAAKYRSLILPINRNWMHDGWTALLLSAVSRGLAIAEPLVTYRQHADQSIGAARRTMYQQYLNAKKMGLMVFAEQADAYEAALARLQEQTDYDVPTVVISGLQEKIKHCRLRSAIRLGKTSKLAAVPELLKLRYRRFSLGWKSFAQDLFL
jgi:glycosyltransferase involved in cell wall biosynthesis